MRRLEIPTRPGRESQERRRGSAPEMVFLRREFERPPSVFHRLWHVAQNQSNSGAVHGHRTGQTAKILFVHDDHLGRWGFRSPPDVFFRIQPPFGIPQSRLDAIKPATLQQRPGIVNAEYGPEAE